MADLIDFLPVFRENVATIRARMDANANLGVSPTSGDWADTAIGGFYFMVTQTAALEAERMYDMLATEIVAASFPQYAWGEYLDLHGEVVDTARKPEAAATGIVTFTGDVGALIGTGTQVSVEQTDPDTDPQVFRTASSATIPAGGSIDVPIIAVEAGLAGNVGAGLVTVPLTPVAGVDTVVNAAPTSGGADVEDDEPYRARILLEFQTAQGAGTAADYVRWTLAQAGVGSVTVEPLYAGPGTVRVIAADTDRNPLGPAALATIQAALDPVPEHGAGLAPIGAAVTVVTPVRVVVDVAADVTLATGYTTDGAGGTTAVQGEIEAAISDYIDSLAPGDDVILAHVSSRFFAVEGVLDVGSVTLAAPAATPAVPAASANLVLAADHVAALGTVTLT